MGDIKKQVFLIIKEARRKVMVGFTKVSGTLTSDTKSISRRHIFHLEEDGNKVFWREIFLAQ